MLDTKLGSSISILKQSSSVAYLNGYFLQACTESSECKSVDFSTEREECFRHTKDEETLQNDGSIRTSVSGVDHYVKVDTCGEQFYLCPGKFRQPTRIPA